MKRKSIFLCLLYVGVLGLAIYFTNGSGMESLIINSAVFIIIAFIFLYSYIKFRTIEKIENDLITATNKLKNEDSDIDLENLFNNEILSREYKKYLNEMKRISDQSNSLYKCDISDYINVELIDLTIKKNLLNLVPGTMTGLGILGTFLGLSFALQNFDLSGTSEEVANSITPLMDGIKVAFHTSIFGMIFSLLYNFFYKWLLEEAYISVDEFLYVYSKTVTGNAKYDNESLIQKMIQELPEQMGNRMQEAFHSEFVKVNEAIEVYIQNTGKAQTEGVERIVEKFINEMDKSLGDNFSHLGEVLEQTSALQKESNAQMREVLSETGKMTISIKEIHDLSGKTIESMSEYISNIEKLQGDINNDVKEICEKFDHELKSIENMTTQLDIFTSNMVKYTDGTSQLMNQMNNQMVVMKEIQDNLSKVTDEQIKTILQTVEEYSEKLTTLSKEYELNLAEFTNKVIQGIENNVEQYNVDLFNSSKNQLNEINTTASKVTSTMEQTILDMNDLANNFEKTLSSSSNDVIKEIQSSTQKYNQTLFETSQKQLSEIKGTANGVTQGLREATQGLSAVSQNLSINLKKSLDGVFEAFDKELSTIALSLSGTIQEVEATTNRVPKTVEISYKGLEKSMGEFKNSFDGLVNNLREYEEKMSLKIKNMEKK